MFRVTFFTILSTFLVLLLTLYNKCGTENPEIAIFKVLINGDGTF